MKYAIHNTQYSIRNKHHSKRSTLPAVRSASSTSVEKPLQISPFFTNKPNVKIDKISLSVVVINYYDSEHRKMNSRRHKNKPNSNPNKPNFGPISRVSKAKQSQFKPKQTQSVRKFFKIYLPKMFVHAYHFLQQFPIIKEPKMKSRYVFLLCLPLLVISAWNLNCLHAQNSNQEKGIYLIVRGDDIGSSHAANLACIRSYKEGIMRTVELMVPCPWFPEAVKMLNENPGLDVGVHIVLTSEWENIKWRPLTHAPSLTDADGYFYSMIWQRKDFPPGTALKEANWKIEEIEKEMRAQIELAKRKVPHISHLTCHMGCSSWDPKVSEVYMKLAKEYNLDISPSEYGVKGTGGWRGAKTAKDRTKRFMETLEGLKPGTYLFVEHPGLDTAEMRAIGHKGYYDVAKDRDAVTEIFTSPDVKRTIDKLGIKLISYADLRKKGVL
jgi:predicted glycoside hydrolase/deacetylase ChbG (UPF0249 family)